MFHVRNKNIRNSRIIPLFKEKSTITDHVRIQKPGSAKTQLRSHRKNNKTDSLKTPKHVTGDSSMPSFSSDIENVSYQSCNGAITSYPKLLHVTEEFWDSNSTSRSDRRILESTGPSFPGDGQRESEVSRWQRIKKQFKRFKDAVTCSSDSITSETCSIPTSPMTLVNVPSSLTSDSIVPTPTITSKSTSQEHYQTDSAPDQSNDEEYPKMASELLDDEKVQVYGNKSDDTVKTLEIKASAPKSTVRFERSSDENSFEESMECSEPPLSSVSSIGKYWDNHPISQSCRNIFKETKSVMEETIIRRGRSSPWKVLRQKSSSKN